jgi:anti-sigma regulatory factor (Ser/Thr protein kinase)
LSHSVAAYSTAGVCAVCSAPLPNDAKVSVLPETSYGISRSVPAGVKAAAEARRVVANLPFSEHARDRLALLVSELVTNAIRHAGLGAGDPIDLLVASKNGRVFISVKDGGPGFEPLVNGNGNGNGSAAAPGFGLSIVDALSEEWGVDREPEGCTVWCALNAEGIAA